MLEHIEKVFKVVMAEENFTEIYDHSSNKEFMSFFKVNKKALVVFKKLKNKFYICEFNHLGWDFKTLAFTSQFSSWASGK